MFFEKGGGGALSSDDVFQETSARCRAVEPISGSNVIPTRARPGLAGLGPHNATVCGRDWYMLWDEPVLTLNAPV